MMKKMPMHTEEEMMAMDKKDLVKMIMDMKKMMGDAKCKGGECTGSK